MTAPDAPAVMRDADAEQLVTKLTRQVTHRGDPPYPELRTALEALIERIRDSGDAEDPIDWPVIISEAVLLRPSHE